MNLSIPSYEQTLHFDQAVIPGKFYPSGDPIKKNGTAQKLAKAYFSKKNHDYQQRRFSTTFTTPSFQEYFIELVGEKHLWAEDFHALPTDPRELYAYFTGVIISTTKFRDGHQIYREWFKHFPEFIEEFINVEEARGEKGARFDRKWLEDEFTNGMNVQCLFWQVFSTFKGIAAENKCYKNLNIWAEHHDSTSIEWAKPSEETHDIDLWIIQDGHRTPVSVKSDRCFSQTRTITDYRVRDGKNQPVLYLDQYLNKIQFVPRTNRFSEIKIVHGPQDYQDEARRNWFGEGTELAA